MRIGMKGEDEMVYVRFWAAVLWYTLGAVVICGLGISLCRRAFLALLGRTGRGIVIATSIVGTPVHELGHALMCLLFGHRITQMCLWNPRAADGNLGYVTHRYNRRNPIAVLGLLFIGLGPILLGTLVLTLTLWLCFPEALSGYAEATAALLSGKAGVGAVLAEGLRLIPRVGRELIGGTARPLWARVLGVLVLLSVSLHMELSPADLKSALRALPLYGVIALIVTVVCGLVGAGAMDAVTGALRLASAYMVALFAVIFAAAMVQLVIALPIYLMRRLVGRR